MINRIINPMFSKRLITVPLVVFLALCVATSICYYYYSIGNNNTKSTALLAGFVSGLSLVILQFLFSWADYAAVGKLNQLGVKDIFLNRDDRKFYERLITRADRKIDVLGVTASRFIEHFADGNTHRAETKVLLSALARGVNVRILVQNPSTVATSDKAKAHMNAPKLAQLASQYSGTFHYKYFTHEPAHSIVVVDDVCIIGPVFPDIQSSDTPAIYLNANSDFAKRYIEYLEQEWNKGTSP